MPLVISYVPISINWWDGVVFWKFCLNCSFLESQAELSFEEKLFNILKDTQASLLVPQDLIPFLKGIWNCIIFHCRFSIVSFSHWLALIDDNDQLSLLLPTGSFQMNAYSMILYYSYLIWLAVTMVIASIFHRISLSLSEFNLSKDDFSKNGGFLSFLLDIQKTSIFWEVCLRSNSLVEFSNIISKMISSICKKRRKLMIIFYC
jgi:hypothetical protein